MQIIERHPCVDHLHEVAEGVRSGIVGGTIVTRNAETHVHAYDYRHPEHDRGLESPQPTPVRVRRYTYNA